jgi:hypothetical protein
VYAAAAAVGILTAIVAGKPVWARAAKVEALLKAVVGAFIAVTSMFGIRKWLPGVTLDLSRIGAGAGAVGDLPRVALPLVGMALALVFEVDDAFGPEVSVHAPRPMRAGSADSSEAHHEPEEESRGRDRASQHKR